MKFGIVLETKEHEKAWNAFRFGVKSLENRHEVKTFLMGEAVECEGIVDEKFDVSGQMKNFIASGGEILACGTCIKSRQLKESDLCPISTMQDLVDLVVWADRILSF